MADTPSNPFGPPSSPPPFPWKQPWSWGDAAKARANANAWTPSRSAERNYERQLLSVVGQIRSVLATSADLAAAEKLIREYAELLDPWARQSAANMMFAVNRKNVQAWTSVAGRAGIDMRRLLNSPGIGEAVALRVRENASKIKGLVLESADKVAEIAQEALITGSRADDLAKRIAKVGEISESRARTIARTEVSKAGTALTFARASEIGSTGYIWRTARDGGTRESHRAMEGVFVRWDSPPTIDGMTGHAGEFPNCRCYPEPVIPRSGRGGVHKPALPTRGREMNAGEKQLLSHWERQSGSAVIPHVADKPLVNVDKAVFDPRKLTRYSLDPEAKNPRGRDKAQLFNELLGMEKQHAGLIEKQVGAWLEHLPAVRTRADKYGERFEVYVPVTGPNGRTVDVMTAWIYDRDDASGKISATPRLINCFITRKSKVGP